MPHKRSMAARQRRAAKRLILNTARRDPHQAETICLLTPRQLMTKLQTKFKDGVYEDAANCERGEILIDARGRGSLQQVRRE